MRVVWGLPIISVPFTVALAAGKADVICGMDFAGFVFTFYEMISCCVGWRICVAIDMQLALTPPAHKSILGSEAKFLTLEATWHVKSYPHRPAG